MSCNARKKKKKLFYKTQSRKKPDRAEHREGKMKKKKRAKVGMCEIVVVLFWFSIFALRDARRGILKTIFHFSTILKMKSQRQAQV